MAAFSFSPVRRALVLGLRAALAVFAEEAVYRGAKLREPAFVAVGSPGHGRVVELVVA